MPRPLFGSQISMRLLVAVVSGLCVWSVVCADGPRISNAVRRPNASAVEKSPERAERKGDKATDAAAQDKTETPSVGPGEVELKSSRVYTFVGKTGLGHEHAIIGTLKSGELHLSREEDAGKLEFDLRSFIADTPEARKYIGLKGETDRATQQKVNQNMLGSEVLDVARHPTATFEIASIKKQRDLKEGAVEYLLEGDFTLHGVAKRIKFTVTAEPAKGWHHIRGKFAIRQTDFGIKPFTTALGAVGIANELTIYGDLWVRPDQPLAEKPQEATR